MIGNAKEKQEYIMDPNRQNIKIYDPADKEAIYREICKKIFSILPEDNANFDQLNEERVTSHLSNNEDLIKLYQYADLTKLDRNSYLTAPFKTTDVIHITSKFKNKAPGMSGVNKLILSNLPHQAIESFTLFTNLAFSMGYYQLIFKNGLVVLAHKTGKDLRFAENYRPITLLGVPGKLMERLINDRASRFFEESNLYNLHQYGFRKRKGTDTAIAVAYETIALTQQKKTALQHCLQRRGQGLRQGLGGGPTIQSVTN